MIGAQFKTQKVCRDPQRSAEIRRDPQRSAEIRRDPALSSQRLTQHCSQRPPVKLSQSEDDNGRSTDNSNKIPTVDAGYQNRKEIL